MSEGDKVQGLPVSGYRPQNQTAVDTVNANKALEELCLRRLDQLHGHNRVKFERAGSSLRTYKPDHDGNMLELARLRLQEAFMWMNRATFQPDRLGDSSQDLLTQVTVALALDDPSIPTPAPTIAD